MPADRPTPKCQSCAVEMLAGRRQDRRNGLMVSDEAWLPGQPDPSWGWPNLPAGNAVQVVTYACPKCGRLESYLQALPTR